MRAVGDIPARLPREANSTEQGRDVPALRQLPPRRQLDARPGDAVAGSPHVRADAETHSGLGSVLAVCDLLAGDNEWARTYAAYRNTIEGTNGRCKLTGRTCR